MLVFAREVDCRTCAGSAGAGVETEAVCFVSVAGCSAGDVGTLAAGALAAGAVAAGAVAAGAVAAGAVSGGPGSVGAGAAEELAMGDADAGALPSDGGCTTAITRKDSLVARVPTPDMLRRIRTLFPEGL